MEQLEKHLQSTYRAKHSTETALLKVQNEVLSSFDVEGSVVVLIMLDLAAAFATTEHALLLSRLHDMYGIHDQALAWIRSYLSDRLQRVNIKGLLSVKQESWFSSGICSRADLVPTGH